MDLSDIGERFDVVLADPPWSYTGRQDKWGAAAKFYDTMADEDLFALPVADIMAERSVLFCWATCPRLDLAIRCGEAWGLTFRGVAFVWVKTRKSDPSIPIGAQGVRPSIVKPTTEMVLAFSKVAKGRPLPLANEAIPQVVLAPRQEHSRKPDEVHERIEAMYPDAARIELFARRERDGWRVWGNEVSNLVSATGSDRCCPNLRKSSCSTKGSVPL